MHGSIDPWHALGIFESNDPKLPTIYIQGKNFSLLKYSIWIPFFSQISHLIAYILGTAHCANMYEPKDTDFPQLKQAREKIREFLHALIADEDSWICDWVN